MCGIYFSCSRKEHIDPNDATTEALRARGPDSLKYHHAHTNHCQVNKSDTLNSAPGHSLTFVSSVLSLRGDQVCVQPLIDPSTESVLCWNGEAWRVDGSQVKGNDTQKIFNLLLNASKNTQDQDLAVDSIPYRIANVLTRVAGPYAFVYFDAPTSTVYFGRDRLGRRSLVRNVSVLDESSSLVLSSLNLGDQPAVEVLTDGVHYYDLRSTTPITKLVPWPLPNPSINSLLPPEDLAQNSTPSIETVTNLREELTRSLLVRVLDVPTYTITNNDVQSQMPSRIAILFSGGLDCSLLARLAHDVLPTDQPIDLLNVAFENPRTIRAAAQSKNSNSQSSPPTSPYETCPDRITARSSFLELFKSCPKRTWRFVAINIPYTETRSHRSTVIKLMSPHNTEMDLSITLALYFASRGQGEAITTPTSIPTPYTTTSRVLLSGLGADELFAGYTRHAAAFTRSSYAGLISELSLDFTRIGTRNLGRDDRVMAHWGREIRYPYLDEDFVAFTLSLPVWEKCGFRTGKPVPRHNEGSIERVTVERPEDLEPAKMALRLVAWDLGLRGIAAERKRAIQFGARTAKMEGGRTKGTDSLGSATG